MAPVNGIKKQSKPVPSISNQANLKRTPMTDPRDRSTEHVRLTHLLGLCGGAATHLPDLGSAGAMSLVDSLSRDPKLSRKSPAFQPVFFSAIHSFQSFLKTDRHFYRVVGGFLDRKRIPGVLSGK